jgi:hypothetical protein
MAVTRLSQSSLREGLEKYTTALGNYVPSLGVLDSIQTVTVGAGGTASIDFSSIPNRFQHLHLRLLSRTTQSSGSAYSNILLRLNGDSGANYSLHYLQGDGATTYSGGNGSATGISQAFGANALSNASVFAYNVIDICDYASTSKNKTVRIFQGYENNTGSGFNAGFPGMNSGAWFNTAAVSSISLTVLGGTNHAQHTVAHLYGVVAR